MSDSSAHFRESWRSRMPTTDRSLRTTRCRWPEPSRFRRLIKLGKARCSLVWLAGMQRPNHTGPGQPPETLPPVSWLNGTQSIPARCKPSSSPRLRQHHVILRARLAPSSKRHPHLSFWLSWKASTTHRATAWASGGCASSNTPCSIQSRRRWNQVPGLNQLKKLGSVFQVQTNYGINN